MRRIFAPLAIVISFAAITAGGLVVSQGGGDPAPSGVANIWIDATGGTCTDSATAIAYDNATACSWSAAVTTCEGGDTVRVMAGSYGDVNLLSTANNGRSAGSRCNVIAEEGQTITADEFELAHYSACGTGGVSFINITGPMNFRTLDTACNQEWTFDNITVDANNTVGQVFVLYIGSNVVFKNGDISGSCAGAETGSDGAMIFIEGNNSGLQTFENNVIHEAYAGCGGADPHSECMYAQAVDRLVLRRNHFYKCVFFDVFVTGAQGDNEADDYVLENNIFEMPCTGGTCTTYGGGNPAVKTRDGGFPDPACVNWSIRFNIFVTGPQCNNPSATTMRGNVFLGDNPCGSSGVTSTYNAFVLGACGTNGSNTSEATYNSGWTGGSARWPMNADLLTGSVLKNIGPTSDYPTLDIDGNTRFDGSAADVGPSEFQE